MSSLPGGKVSKGGVLRVCAVHVKGRFEREQEEGWTVAGRKVQGVKAVGTSQSYRYGQDGA